MHFYSDFRAFVVLKLIIPEEVKIRFGTDFLQNMRSVFCVISASLHGDFCSIELTNPVFNPFVL